MKILLITKHSPFKKISGAYQRTNLLCRALAKIALVDVLSLEQDIESNIDNCSLLKINNIRIKEKKNSKVNLFELLLPAIVYKMFDAFFLWIKILITNKVLSDQSKYLKTIVKDLQKKNYYDYIVVRYIDNFLLFGLKATKKIIIDVDDLPEQFYSSESKLIKINNIKSIYRKLFLNFCLKRARYCTKKIVKRVKFVYLPNKEQCSLFNNAFYLPNIPYPFNDNKILYVQKIKNNSNRYNIMFVGVLLFWPSNYLGVKHFLENIYPKIINEIPNVNFNIIGIISDETKIEWEKKYKNIKIHGLVDDLCIEYINNDLVVVPVYQGAGTNIKVLEAMYMGKPCVISPYAGRGFDDLLVDGENILIANDDNEFVNKIIWLLKNRELANNLGKIAKKAVDKKYSFDNFLKIIKDTIYL
jgi:glycosyltransferase involved in cell wall biosynthesis